MPDGAQATDKTRRVQTLSTIGVFVVLAWFCTWRRRRQDRARADAVAAGLLTRCWPDEEDSDHIFEVALAKNQGLCMASSTSGASCSHLAEAHEHFRTAGDMRSRLRCGLFSLISLAFSCEACASAASDLLGMVREIIDERLPEVVDSTDPLMHAELERRAATRARKDEDYRRAIMDSALKSGRARTSTGAAQLSGVSAALVAAWQHQQMSSLLTSSWRQFSQFSGVMGLYEDAARIGHPAEDTLVMVVEDPARSISVYLPNQVWRISWCADRSIRHADRSRRGIRGAMPSGGCHVGRFQKVHRSGVLGGRQGATVSNCICKICSVKYCKCNF